MIALVKNNKNGYDIIYPIPDWIDVLAFTIFDCYGYSLCTNYHTVEGKKPEFYFDTREINNPYKEHEDDPETVLQRIAVQK